MKKIVKNTYIFLLILFFTTGLLSDELISGEKNVRQKVTAIIQNNSPPYSFIKNGKREGISLDILKHIAEISGFDVVFNYCENAEEAASAVVSGKADIAPVSRFELTGSDFSFFSFSDPIASSGLNCFVRADKNIYRNMADLAGKRIGVFKKNIRLVDSKYKTGYSFIQFDSVHGGIFELVFGGIDAFICETGNMRHTSSILGADDKIKVLNEEIASSEFVLLIDRRNARLLEDLNNGIRKLEASGELKRIKKGLVFNQEFTDVHRDTIRIIAGFFSFIIGIFVILRYKETKKKNRELKDHIKVKEKLEERLHASRVFLDNIIDSMPSIIIGLDKYLHVTLWNKAAEAEFGISAKEMTGSVIHNIFKSHKLVDEIQSAVVIGENLSIEKYPYHTEHGVKYYNFVVYPLTADGLDGAVVRIDNITDKIHLEDIMVQTEKMMTVGGLAAGMAHEINNPLGIIIQGIQNTMRRVAPDMEKNIRVAEECGITLERMCRYLKIRGIFDYLEGIREAGTRASRIVSNMLDFSRRSESKMASVNVKNLIYATIELAINDYDLKKKFDFRFIDIVIELSAELPELICSKNEIEQVLFNLLKNAAQAFSEMQDRKYLPQIVITTRKEENEGVIEVKDNGPGMSEEVRKRIFEPFYTTKDVGVGTGLGLSVSYFIITNNHKGSIKVESEPGAGAKFIIRIPLERNDL